MCFSEDLRLSSVVVLKQYFAAIQYHAKYSKVLKSIQIITSDEINAQAFEVIIKMLIQDSTVDIEVKYFPVRSFECFNKKIRLNIVKHKTMSDANVDAIVIIGTKDQLINKNVQETEANAQRIEGASDLRCKTVINAITPKWGVKKYTDAYMQTFEKDIAKTVKSVCKVAGLHNCQSISLTLFGESGKPDLLCYYA